MTEKQIMTDVLIVGAGTAGLTAAVYAARAGKSVKLVEQYLQGGQIINASHVENFPGFESIAGFEFAEALYNQAIKMGAEIVYDKVTGLQDYGSHKGVQTEYGGELLAKAVILATGARVRPLGLENEDRFIGSGVSYCATCDGAFFKDKNVAVVGGGNSALEEALYLTNFAKNVTIIHRRDAFRADKTMQERVAQNHKINVIWNCVVEEILGTESPLGVTGLRLKNVKTDNTTDVAVDGVFIAIGHHPNTDLVKGHLHLDKENYIVTKHNSCETSIKGVFAAGDVRDPQYRQAIIAAGSGCIAALEAEKYLNELGEQKNAVKPEAV